MIKIRRILSCLVLILFVSGAIAVGISFAQDLRPLTAEQKERLYQMAGAKNGPIVTYDYEAKPIQLKQNLRKVAVELTEYNNKIPLRANRSLRAMTSVTFAKSSARDFVRSRFIMEWTDGSIPSPAEWNTRASALRGYSSVKAIWPVYVYPPTGIDVYCPGEVSVKLGAGVSTETLVSIAGKEGLYLLDKKPSETNVVVLRMKDPTGSDPFTLARKLAENKAIAAWASPNLSQSYKLYSNWAPWPSIPMLDAFSGSADPLANNQWHLNQSNFNGLHNEMKYMSWPPLYGENGYFPLYHYKRIPTVGIVDTGVDYAHEDLWPNIWRSWNEYQNELNPYDGIDNDWNQYTDDLIGWDFWGDSSNPFGMEPHGTACAGIATARGFNGLGVRGGSPFLAPMPIKVAEYDAAIGTARFVDDTKLARALTYAGMMCDVVSNSWGGGAPHPAIHEAIMYCRTFGRLGHWWQNDVYTPVWRGAGTPVLFAAGNEYDNALAYPAADIWSIAVGAVDRFDKRASYSNIGEGLDIVAPAGSVTTDITGSIGTDYSTTNYTDTFSGTSSATPLAASVLLSSVGHNFRKLSDKYIMGDRFQDTFFDHIDTETMTPVYRYEHFTDPVDQINMFIDPRDYLVGELTQSLLRGAQMVNPTHGNYRTIGATGQGYSFHYGWGRLDAKKTFDLVRKDIDDVYEETLTNPKDPSTISICRYLRPGRTKWLLARDNDYFLVPMAAGSSARVTVTYLRHAWNTPNTLKPGPTRDKYGPFADETTTPRLKVSWWPDQDPYWPYAPTDHKAQNDPKGQPIHPINTVIENATDSHRLEDRIVTTLYYESPKSLKTDQSIDWDKSAPNRPLRDKDTAYYLMVSPIRQYINPRSSGSDTTKTYSPMVEYHIDFDYWPAPSNHSVTRASQTVYPPPFDIVVNNEEGYYGNDYYSSSNTDHKGYVSSSGYAIFQNGNARRFEDNLPMGAFPVLAAGTTTRSVSYTNEQQYSYPAFHEPLHRSDPFRANNSHHSLPAAYGQMFNAMVTFDPNQSNIGVGLYDDFWLGVAFSWNNTAPAESIWNIMPARKARYNLAYGTWIPGGNNNKLTGVHYSFVNVIKDGSSTQSKPVEFTQTKIIQAGSIKLHQLDLSFYPFEHLNDTTAPRYEKNYLLKTNAREGARLTVVQNRNAQSSQNFFVWLFARDSAGLGAGRAEDFDIGRSLYFHPMDKATTYSIQAYLVALNAEAAANPPQDVRFMLAVDRPKLPVDYTPKAPYAKPKGVPDLAIKEMTLNRTTTGVHGPLEDLMIKTLRFKNIGSHEITTYTVRLVDTKGFLLDVPLPPLKPTEEKVFSDYLLPTSYAASEDKITTYILAVHLDPDDKHYELREDNNLTTVGISLYPTKADLILAGPVTIVPSPLGAGVKFSPGFFIKNNSPYELPSTATLKLKITDTTTGKLLHEEEFENVGPKLPPNTFFELIPGVIQVQKGLTYGKHTLKYEIIVDDANPTNNSLTRTIDVRKGAAENWNDY